MDKEERQFRRWNSCEVQGWMGELETHLRLSWTFKELLMIYTTLVLQLQSDSIQMTDNYFLTLEQT